MVKTEEKKAVTKPEQREKEKDKVLLAFELLLQDAFSEASEALAQFTGSNLSIKMTAVWISDIIETPTYITPSEQPYVGMNINMYQGIRGSLLTLFDAESAKRIARSMVCSRGFETGEECDGITDMERSALLETANILGSKFASRLGDSLKRTVYIMPPVIREDMFWPMIQEIITRNAENIEEIIFIKAEILTAEAEEPKPGIIVFIPTSSSYKTMIDTISMQFSQ